MGKTQQKLPQYRCPKKIKGKTKRRVLLLLQILLSLSLSCATQVSVCVPNEEFHTSIYICPFTLIINSDMQVQVTTTGVLMTHLYNLRGVPHDSYQLFRLEASGYKIIQVVLPVGPSGITKDTYRIFFEVTIFQQTSPTPVVLKDPFPSQQHLIDHKSLN